MANKFNPQGLVKYLWVPTILNTSTPKVSELTIGATILDLSCDIINDGVEGFGQEPTTIDATPLCATAEENVPGLSSTTPGAFTMFRANASADTGSILFDKLVGLEGTEGYVVALLAGVSTVGALVDVFPSQLSKVNAMPLTGGQAARYKVSFTHYGPFKLNVKVVAS